MYDFLEQYCIDNREQLYRLAYSYTRNREDALDVVSEAVLKALDSRKKLRDPQAVRTWMYRIVVHAALDLLRARGRLRTVPVEELENQPDMGERRDTDLYQAVEELPEPYHTVIVLRFFEDLKIGDVARVLGANANTVKTQLYTALKLLRLELGDGETL